jgi:hypothetical protein
LSAVVVVADPHHGTLIVVVVMQERKKLRTQRYETVPNHYQTATEWHRYGLVDSSFYLQYVCVRVCVCVQPSFGTLPVYSVGFTLSSLCLSHLFWQPWAFMKRGSAGCPCRRLEAEKEKQELIRQGLLEPPKPKLKLSTFSRSMGVEAAADPTMVEQQVRADQEARQQVCRLWFPFPESANDALTR